MLVRIRKTSRLKMKTWKDASNTAQTDVVILMNVASKAKNLHHITRKITLESMPKWEPQQFIKLLLQNQLKNKVFRQHRTNRWILLSSHKDLRQDFISTKEGSIISLTTQSKLNLGCQEWESTITTKVFISLRKELAKVGSEIFVQNW